MSVRITLRPVVTEKSLRLANDGIYTFVVPHQANKLMISDALEAAYSVHVVSVNIVKLPGKIKRRGRVSGKTTATVKALVRLKKGETIKGYELTVPEAASEETSDKGAKQPEENAKKPAKKQTAKKEQA